MTRLGTTCWLLAWTLLIPALSSCDSITGPAPTAIERTCDRIGFTGGWYLRGEWSPDGKKVAATTAFDAFGRYSRGLHIVDVRSGHEERVASFDEIGFPFDIRWNPKPESTLLLFSYGLSQATFDYSTREWVALDGGGYSTRDAVWTPDGDSIVFVRLVPLSDPPELNGMHVVERHGRGMRRILLPDGGLVVPNGPVRFSPDGHWMAYRENVRAPNGNGTLFNEIAIIGRDGRGHRTLTHLRGDVDDIQWIQGGRALLFTYREAACVMVGGNTPVHTMFVDVETGRVGRWRVELTEQRYQFGWNFTLDPAGERALVVRNDPDYRFVYEGIHYHIGALYVMPIGGGKTIKLVRSSGPPPPDSQSGGPSPNELFAPAFTPPSAAPH